MDWPYLGVAAGYRCPDSVGAIRPRLVGVVDANALLSSIHNHCKTGRPTFLIRMQGFGTTQLYAADHVFTEVYEKLPKLASRNGSAGDGPTLDQLRTCLEQHYLPLVRFVTISESALLDSDVQLIPDIDDRPSGALAKLLSPCIVFSEDKDLRRPGFAPENWRESARAAADVASGDAQLYGAAALVGLPAAGAIYGARAAASKLEVSPWLIGGVVAALAAAVWVDSGRRSRTRVAMSAVGSTALRSLEPAVDAQQRGLKRLREDLYYVTSDPDIKQVVAAVLARSPRPLLPSEIRERPGVVEWGLTASEIRGLLRSEDEFVRPAGETSRWQLGRRSTGL